MLFLVEPLTRSEQNTRRDHPITAPSHPATKAIATTEHNVLTHPLKTPHNYPPLTPPLSKGCRYGVIRRCDSAISRPCCRRRSPHCATRRRARPWPPYDHPRKSSRKQAPAPPPPSRHRRSRLIRHRLRRLHPRPALLRLHRLRHRPRLHRLHSRHRQYFLYSKRASPIYSSARRRSAGALCNHTTSMGSHELAGTTRRRPLFASRGLASSAPATTVLVAEPAKAVHGLRTWPRAVQGRHPYMAESRTEPAKAVHGRQSRTWAPSVHGREPYIWPPTLARSRPRLARPADGPPHLSPKPPPSLSPARCAPGGTLRRPKQITVITVTDHRPIKRMPRYRSVCTAARCIGPVAPSSSSPPWTSTRRTCTGCIDDRDGITNAAHTTRHAAPVRATSRRTADAAAGRAASRAPGSRRGEHTHAPRIGVSTTSATQL